VDVDEYERAVAVALEQLKKGKWDKKVLIVISDGGDNASRTTFVAGNAARMAAAAREMVAGRCSWEAVAREFEVILERAPGFTY